MTEGKKGEGRTRARGAIALKARFARASERAISVCTVGIGIAVITCSAFVDIYSISHKKNKRTEGGKAEKLENRFNGGGGRGRKGAGQSGRGKEKGTERNRKINDK